MEFIQKVGDAYLISLQFRQQLYLFMFLWHSFREHLRSFYILFVNRFTFQMAYLQPHFLKKPT